MKKIVILVIVLLTNNNFCGGFDPNRNRSEQVIEVLQHIVKTDGCGAPYSLEIMNSCKNAPPNSFTKELGVIGLTIAGIGATYSFVSNMMTWKPVVAEAVHAANATASAYDKNTQPPTSPRTKRAKEETDKLSIQQLQLLAVTEEKSTPGTTYWKDKYQEALRNQVK